MVFDQNLQEAKMVASCTNESDSSMGCSCPNINLGHVPSSNLGQERISSNGMFCVKEMNEILADPKNQSPIPAAFGQFFFKKEIMLLGGTTNSGKSLAAMDIAIAVATGLHYWGENFSQELREKVLLIDSEMNEHQWAARYCGVAGIGSIFRASFWNEKYHGKEIDEVLENIEDILSSEYAPKLIIVDNLSTISSLVSPSEVLRLIFQLKRMKEKYSCSMVLVSHTNKKQPGKPIQLDDFRGSKVLVNLVDSVVAICPSCEGSETKYWKLLKSRNCRIPDTVSVVHTVEDPYLHFEYIGEVDEVELLPQPKKRGPSSTITAYDAEKILEMAKHGLSIRDISENIGVSKSTVGRFLKSHNTDQF